MESPQPSTGISGLEGQRLGPYELVELLGRGSMAVVYRALQPALRRHVAVKVLSPHFAREEGFRARFQREAEIVALLEHPNILPIYDYGQEGEVPYIIMPLVGGGTLREWLDHSLPLERALRVLSRVLSALEYAHTRRPAIVHRDLKPSNILMSQDDWPLLADFGLARIVEPSARATGSGTLIGTPEYMAPEQSRGGPVDHRADLYAMGIVLYEILTGRVPFQGQTLLAVIRQHLSAQVPSPRTFNPALSSVWDVVLQRCLAKDPRDRYPSARALDEAIQAAWQQQASDEGPTIGAVDLGQLHDDAARALAQGDWSRVISLCRVLLKIDPEHSEAVQLLAQAHEALRRHRAKPRGQRAAERPGGVPPPAVLTVREGAEPGRTYPLARDVITLGRAADNTIALRDSAVSRRHCQIRWARDAYVVEDRGSSNGTYVNGAVVQTAPLRSGDLIQVGNLVLEFTLGEGAEAAQLGEREPEKPSGGTRA